jgi:hypothetical protein
MLTNAPVCSTVPLSMCSQELIYSGPWIPKPDERKHS